MLPLFIREAPYKLGGISRMFEGVLGRVAMNWIVEDCPQMVSRIMVCARSDVSTVSTVEEKEKTT